MLKKLTTEKKWRKETDKTEPPANLLHTLFLLLFSQSQVHERIFCVVAAIAAVQ